MVLIVALAVLLLPAAGLAAFGIASARWGVDSRDGSRDPRRPDQPAGLG